MGAAAYNRGSRTLSRLIEMERGTYSEPKMRAPRPETWGKKAKERALERATLLLRGLRRLGYQIDVEAMAWEVADRARVGFATAQEAVRLALTA